MTGLLLVTGCASMVTGRAGGAIRLKIIDARTGQPLSGVYGVWREDLDDVAFGHFQNGPAEFLPSNDSGIITINESHKKMTGRFILSHTGYVTIYGVYSDGSLEVSREIQPPPLPQDFFELDDAQNVLLQSDGCFLIEMPKEVPLPDSFH